MTVTIIVLVVTSNELTRGGACGKSDKGEWEGTVGVPGARVSESRKCSQGSWPSCWKRPAFETLLRVLAGFWSILTEL